MKQIATFLACAVVLMSSFTSSAQSDGDSGIQLYNRNGWNVHRLEDSCYLTAAYARSSVHITINERANNAILNVISENFGSIVDGQIYNIQMHFVNLNNRRASSCDDLEFRGMVLPDSRGVAVVLNLQDFAEDFSRFQRFGLYYQERMIGAFDLDGSAAAFAALRSCDRELERDVPTDPFSGRRGGQR